MPRKLLIRSDMHPYHIACRSNNGDWFSLPLHDVWDICLQSLKKAHSKYPIELISFVLMSNHYHMLLRTPHANLDKFMYELNKEFSLRLRFKTERINRMFGGRYKWCLIKNQKYFINCYRYVYQNPIRAGIVKNCESYPYSTLSFINRGEAFIIPLFDHFGFKDLYGLRWLNQAIAEKEFCAIKSALRRSVMDKLINRDSRKLISINAE